MFSNSRQETLESGTVPRLAPTNEDKLVLFTIGLPGSGKTYQANRLFGSFKSVDPDSQMGMMLSYSDDKCEEFHAIAKEFAALAFESAIRNGQDRILYDSTGTDIAGMLHKIRQARSLGYSVALLYVSVSVTTALARNASRDRRVPDQVIWNKASQVGEAFEILKWEADKVVRIDC